MYVDPASIFSKNHVDIIPGVYPFIPMYRRNRKLEQVFLFGIYDAGINRLVRDGDYGDWWEILPDIPLFWEQVIPDYPWDVVRHSPRNTRTPDRCLRDSDFLIEKYYGFPKLMPSLQYLFGDAVNLRQRLRNFHASYPRCLRYGIGNTCKLRNERKQKEIARVLLAEVRETDFIHIFGCPTFLFRYLLQHASFSFSVDSNKFPWEEVMINGKKVRRRVNGKAGRRNALVNYLKKVGYYHDDGKNCRLFK